MVRWEVINTEMMAQWVMKMRNGPLFDSKNQMTSEHKCSIVKVRLDAKLDSKTLRQDSLQCISYPSRTRSRDRTI